MNIIRQSPVLRLFIAGLATLFLLLGGATHSRASQLSGHYTVIAGTKITICDTESGGHDKGQLSLSCDQCVLCSPATLPPPETGAVTKAIIWQHVHYFLERNSVFVTKIWPVQWPRGPPSA